MPSIVRSVLAVAVLVLTAIPASAQPIKVGTIFPLSGGAGPNGQAVTSRIGTNRIRLLIRLRTSDSCSLPKLRPIRLTSPTQPSIRAPSSESGMTRIGSDRLTRSAYERRRPER